VLARVRGTQADAWALWLDENGPHLTSAASLVSAAPPPCDATLDAVLALDDRNGDGRIDSGRGEEARVLVSSSWRRAGLWHSAVMALQLRTGTARITWRHDSDNVPLGRLTAAPTLVRGARAEDDLVVVAGGWPLQPAVDPLHAGGELLAFDARSGTVLPSPFRSRASLVSGITAIDSDGDGSSDRLYFADAAWQVWRLDRASVDREARFTRELLADLSGLAEPGAALQFPPDVVLAGNGGARSLEVTLGTSDAPMRRAARHWLVVLHDQQAVPGPILPTDLRRIDGLSRPASTRDDRGLLLALPGPLTTAVLTVGGQRIVATSLALRDPCALRVTEAEPVQVTTLAPDYSITRVALSAEPKARLTLEWHDAPQGPQLECRLGTAAASMCAAQAGVTRDYWVRKDAP
jgi:hypothetical protein